MLEPKSVLIGGSDGLASCEDLTFVLKGYSCDIPVKFLTPRGVLINGPAGLPIKLRQNMQEGYEKVVNTDEFGVASFEEVPSSIFTAYFDTDGATKASDGGKTLYKLERNFFTVGFNKMSGFILDYPEGFVIESTLVEGFIKQGLSDDMPASFVKVEIRSAQESDLISTVSTDVNGRYQVDELIPGKYIVSPVITDTETH